LTRAPPSRLIVATGNPGKLREFRALLAGLPFQLQSLADLGLEPPEETGTTFLANATLKARHAAALVAAADPGGPAAAVLADDSGLEVDALRGAPGVRSARYAGGGASDAENDANNNAKLAAALAGIPLEERRARYRCVLVLVRGAADADPLVAEGVWEGYILDAPQGAGGFGYDPYFWLPELGLSAAELDPALKNRISHRGMAMRLLRDALAARDWPAKRE